MLGVKFRMKTRIPFEGYGWNVVVKEVQISMIIRGTKEETEVFRT